MQNLFTLMLGIIGASVALLAGLIYFNAEQPSYLPAGSPCAFEKSALNSVLIDGFAHVRYSPPEESFPNVVDSKSTECEPESGSLFEGIIETLAIQEFEFVAEDDARDAIRDFIGFGDHRSDLLGERQIEIVSNPELQLIFLMMRFENELINIVLFTYNDVDDADFEILEFVGLEVANQILGDN